MSKVPYFKQNRDYTCGPACLRMVLAYYGIEQDEVTLTMLCGTNVFGTSARQIVGVAQHFGPEARLTFFETLATLTAVLAEGIPVLAAIDAGEMYEREEFKHSRHMIVVLAVNATSVRCHDPIMGENVTVTLEAFERAWGAAKREVIRIWRKK
jgi:ABC-type bacteriocin/lantibiotic exporter with double-glycine peptidase domain